MYEGVYQLHIDPFRLAPDPKFCFEHQNFRKSRAYMKYALSQGDGILMITGHPGTGKTMLVEHFLQELDRSSLLTATLLNTQVEEDDLLRLVGFGFGMNVRNLDRATILQDLQEFLVTQRRAGHRALLIVDEAQNLSASALEQLRMLTNLRERSQALLQLFLVGQKQLIDVVHTPAMEPLYQRLIAASHLEPLGLEETIGYIEHRLRCAGWRGDPHFTKAIRVLVYRFSGGYPRLINKICGRVLLYGSVGQKHRLDVEDFFSALEQVQDECLMPGNEIHGYGETAAIHEIFGTQSNNADWKMHLTQEEKEFLERSEPSPPSEPAVEKVSSPDAATSAVGSEPAGVLYTAEDRPPEPPARHKDPPDPVVASTSEDASTWYSTPPEPEREYLPGKSGLYDGWKNPWFGIAASVALVLSLLLMFGDEPAHYTIEPASVDELIAFTNTLNVNGATQTLPENPESVDNSTAIQSPEPEPEDVAESDSNIDGKDPSEALPQVALVNTQYSDAEFAILTEEPDIDASVSGKKMPASAIEDAGITDNDEESTPNQQESVDSTTINTEPQSTNPVPEAPPPITSLETTAIAPEAVVPEADTSRDDSVQKEAQKVIEQLLRSARNAYRQDFLTTPRSESAFHYLEQVLDRDPDNQAAKRGMTQIVQRYGVLAEAALKRQRYDMANRLASRGLGIEPGNKNLLVLRAKAGLLRDEAISQQQAFAQQEALIVPSDPAENTSNERGSEGLFGKLKTFFENLRRDEVSVNDLNPDESY